MICSHLHPPYFFVVNVLIEQMFDLPNVLDKRKLVLASGVSEENMIRADANCVSPRLCSDADVSLFAVRTHELVLSPFGGI